MADKLDDSIAVEQQRGSAQRLCRKLEEGSGKNRLVKKDTVYNICYNIVHMRRRIAARASA